MIQINGRTVDKISTVNVENDKDVVKLEFTCPNQVTPQLKLTDCDKVYINYSNADVPDRYLVTDLTPGEGEQADTVTFSWLLGRNAVHSSGSTFFVVCAQKLDAAGEIAQEWNTELTSFNVHRGLETLQQPVKPYEDIFSQIFSDLAKKLIVENIIAGNNVTLDVSGNNITINAEGGASVEVDNVTLENDEGTLKVKQGGIGTVQLTPAVVDLINAFVVEYTKSGSTWSSNKTFEEITAAVSSGRRVYANVKGWSNNANNLFSLIAVTSETIGFSLASIDKIALMAQTSGNVCVILETDLTNFFLKSNVIDNTGYGTNVVMTQRATTYHLEYLQEQIDAITVSSDVIDVVGTYTDLQNYDTAHVKANDIIKVMQDSTHSNAISYYRWVITGGVGAWTYVGSEGPYYTKGETNQLLQDKYNANQGSANAGKIVKVGSTGDLETSDTKTINGNPIIGTGDINVQPVNLTASNITIDTTDWVADSTYPNYGYKAEIAIAGVNASMAANVYFDAASALLGTLAPFCETSNGTVTVYCSTNDMAVTIDKVVVFQ